MANLVLVDGENFLFLLVKIFELNGKIFDKHNIKKFQIRKFLCKVLNERQIKILYYGAKIRKPKDEYLVGTNLEDKFNKFNETQQAMGKMLYEQQIRFVKNGKLKVVTGDACKKCLTVTPRYQEKGVDVSIAVEMIAQGINQDNKVFLLSNDTDLVPAVKYMQDIHKRISYLAYSDSITLGLAKYAKTITFSFEDVENYFE